MVKFTSKSGTREITKEQFFRIMAICKKERLQQRKLEKTELGRRYLAGRKKRK